MISNIVCNTLTSRKHWKPSLDLDEEVPPLEQQPLIQTDRKPQKHQGKKKSDINLKHNQHLKQNNKYETECAHLGSSNADKDLNDCNTEVLESECIKETETTSSATFDPLRLRYWLEIVVAVSHVILIFLGIKVLNVIMHFYIMYKLLYTHIDLVSIVYLNNSE